MKISHSAALVAMSLLAAGPALAWSNGTPGQTSSMNQGGSASHDQVMQAQQALQQQGLYQNGQVDGIMGPETRGAIQKFQSANNLPATGSLNSQTLAMLEGGNGPAAAGATGATGTPAPSISAAPGASGSAAMPPSQSGGAAPGAAGSPGSTVPR